MDVNHPQWNDYESRFMTLAEEAELVERPEPSLDRCRFYLCLYGENGMAPEDEFTFLEKMSNHQNQLRKVEVDTNYWQDIVLFVP